MAKGYKKPDHEPKNALTRFMVYTFIPQYANNVVGLVYAGAAILIIVVGLRGLGSTVADNPLVPGFLIDFESGKIKILFVMIALYIEFAMLLLLATVTFFTPEGDIDTKKDDKKGPATIDVSKIDEATIEVEKAQKRLQSQFDSLKKSTEDEINLIEAYLDKFSVLSDKVNKIQTQNIESLIKMRETLKS